jgi:hypothetical protein
MNNRIIRFRAWDKEHGEMMYEIPLGHVTFYKSLNEFFKQTELMQFTGLEDSKGTPIFEGDILKTAGIVTWNQDEVRWGCVDIEWNDKREMHNMLWNTTPLEVIGNIYQHPELLK